MTGSRHGITDDALSSFQTFLLNNKTELIEGHHGDCIGADTMFHKELIKNNIRVVVHPPNIRTARSFCEGTEVKKPKPYLFRNKEIVNASDILVAFPDCEQEIIRSGTWSTVRYARKKGKIIYIFLPNGDFIIEEN